MRFNSRLLAGLTTVALATATIPSAAAQDMISDLQYPYAAPTSVPSDVFLGVGATAADANLNWVTAAGITGQSVQFAPAGTDIAKGEVVEATSTDQDINTTEDYKDRAKAITSYPVATHKATLTGLSENTDYTYRVGSEKDGWSEEFTFNTGTFGNEWGFTFIGDAQIYPDTLADDVAGWKKTIAAATADGKSNFILSAGDQSNYSNYQEHSGFISAPELRKYRTGVNMGNHEMVDPDAYYAMYNRPNVSDENYYFEYNNALVVSLDSNDWEDLEDDIAYLNDTIAAHGTDKDWIILTYHHSSFSQAYHQEDRQIKWWRDNMVPAISAAGVDLVLGGHDHIYTRSHLMNGYQPVDRDRKVVNGEVLYPKEGEVQYIAMNSSSGSKYYDFFDYKDLSDKWDEEFPLPTPEQSEQLKTNRDYTAKWDQDYQPDYMNVSVTPDKLTIKVTNTADGATVDEFSLAKSPAGTDVDGGDNGSAADKDGSAKGASFDGSSFGAGLLTAVIGLIASVGALAFAGFNGQIPGLDIKALAAKFGVKI